MQGRRPKTYKKEDLLKAIEGCKGSFTNVSRKLTKITHIPCCRNTAEKNVNRFEETKQAFYDEVEKMGDLVEQKGFELVENGDGAMIRYYLSTKFRNRGYDLNEQPEQTIPETVDSILIVDEAEAPEQDGTEENAD